jgi:cytochrome c5
MRGVSALARGAALAGGIALAGCGAGEPEDAGARYLADPAFRRAELAASLVDPEDGYARLRLSSYGLAWEKLPVWTPRVEPVTTADLGKADPLRPLGPAARSLSIDAAAVAGDTEALLSLGREAFWTYPVQLLPHAAVALASAESAARYGLVTDPATGRVGGLVRAEMADGSGRLALTCASCHAGARGGAPVMGAPNEALDLGKLAVDAGGVPPELEATLLAWGPGRLDVSSLAGSEPARIADLRPVRFLSHLHQDATVQQRSIASLAIRIETLVITSHHQTLRPPREVALGLALAVWSLADDLPDAAPRDELASRGAAVMESACAPCHHGNGLTGAPVPLSEIGTEPTLGLSPERGTGNYRVPSLRGVSDRGPLLHDAGAPDLDTFFDPDRLSPDYQKGRSPGPIPGHPFNLALSPADREAVLSYLKQL